MKSQDSIPTVAFAPTENLPRPSLLSSGHRSNILRSISSAVSRLKIGLDAIRSSQKPKYRFLDDAKWEKYCASNEVAIAEENPSSAFNEDNYILLTYGVENVFLAGMEGASLEHIRTIIEPIKKDFLLLCRKNRVAARTLLFLLQPKKKIFGVNVSTYYKSLYANLNLLEHDISIESKGTMERLYDAAQTFFACLVELKTLSKKLHDRSLAYNDLGFEEEAKEVELVRVTTIQELTDACLVGASLLKET